MEQKRTTPEFLPGKRTTSERITELQPNEIFVFGSNLKGMHGGGAAYITYRKFGAGGGDNLQLLDEPDIELELCKGQGIIHLSWYFCPLSYKKFRYHISFS